VARRGFIDTYPARSHVGSSSNSYLLQLRVFRFSFLQDGDVAVGIFPQREKVFVGYQRPNTVMTFKT
jgi:hypothetical protein